MMWQSRSAGMSYCGTRFFSLLDSVLSPFLASSRMLKDNFSLCPRSQGYSDLRTTFETAKRSPGFSKIYKRLSPTTRFVHDLGTIFDVFDKGSRWCNKLRSTSKGVD
jgi:hypothetical protein